MVASVAFRLRGKFAALALSLLSSFAGAQTLTSVGVPEKGAGSFSVSFDYVYMDEGDVGELPPGFPAEAEFFVRGRSLNFEFDYGLTDRLALTVTLPYRSNAGWDADVPHDPSFLFNDHGDPFIDDGSYHSYWVDLGLSLRWRWRSAERLSITPFASYYTPTNDYPLYALAQPGRGQWRIDVGANVAGRLGPPRRNMYWKAGYAYSYNEKTEPTDAPALRVNRSRVMLELGWRATPRLTPYVVVTDTTTHDGLGIPDFLPGLLVSDFWYYHDQLFRWEQTAWTLGTAFTLNDQMALSFAYGETQDLDFGFYQDPSFSMAFSYAFYPDR